MLTEDEAELRKVGMLDDESSTSRVYQELKRRAISFEFRPGDRLNEVAIAKEFGVSRTPLREALNRLTGDGFLTFLPKHGFFRKKLIVKEIFDLYELRAQLETGAARLAVERGSDEALASIADFLDHSIRQVPGQTIDELVSLDESFHERLMSLTGNAEMLQTLRNVNARIRYVRWIDMRDRRDITQGEHRAVLQALKARDQKEAEALLRRHIEHRLDQIVDVVKNSYARIYLGEESDAV